MVEQHGAHLAGYSAYSSDVGAPTSYSNLRKISHLAFLQNQDTLSSKNRSVSYNIAKNMHEQSAEI